MAEVTWTKEQLQAIEEKKSNILVAAAAGSGKTAVLVERIIHFIMEDNIDIDKLLVVTFTNAAASEMRQRILDAIYQKLEEQPDDTNLQRQINLLNKASICTIHSFCLDVIRNHFYEIDVSANFRISDTSEIELLKQEVLEDLFEEKYEKQDKDFLTLIHTYTGYRGDEPLKDLILTIYRYIQSSPFPQEWLTEKVEMFHREDIYSDFSNTIWGKLLLEEYHNSITECKLGLESIDRKLTQNPELEKFSNAIMQDIFQLEELQKKSTNWDEAYIQSKQFSFTKWPIDRKICSDLKEQAKGARDKLKKKFETTMNKILIYDSKNANQDINAMYDILILLQKLIYEFEQKFKEKKREKNIIDFNDIEHFALDILVKKQDGMIQPSEIAKQYQEKFTQIAIDEYQDSNLVQEYILNVISKGNNIFMVGDVKQSIYKFRQARPELFLKKYQSYVSKENQKDKEDLKITLFKNFRSRENILQVTNLIFQNIMDKSLGDIDYTQEEYLNLGASFPEDMEKELMAGKTELHIVNLKQDEEQEETMLEQEIQNNVLEAKLVAKMIEELIHSKRQVYDKKQGYRPISYRDIVIVLRSTSRLAPIYEKEIEDRQIPVFSDTSTEYLNSVEIQTILSVLKIIDNPYQDIPLVAVLRSEIGGFCDNDLIEIRLADKQCCFYEAMIKAKLQVSDDLREKIEMFLKQIEQWRSMQEYISLDELIWQIYIDSGYYHYVSLMPNGALRQANLKMLFERAKEYEKASFKGLFNFISFIDKIKLSSGDLGSAKVIGENEDVVRIMSIHKSKGLEFPVVFLAATGKQFNMQDLNRNILLHQDLGIGPNYINYEQRLEYNTSAKEAIRFQMKKEILSEEMRVLYVALTRAKEKLIIVGTSKDMNKALEEKKEELQLYPKTNKINTLLVAKCNSFLDWIELVYLNNQETISDKMELSIHPKEDIIAQEDLKEQEEKKSLEDLLLTKIKEKENTDHIKKIQQELQWEYANRIDTTLPGKISVTKLKENQLQEETILQLAKRTEEHNKNSVVSQKPKFLRNTDGITSAEKGTLVHLCLQQLEIGIDYTIGKLQEMLEKMVAKQMITDKEANQIPVNKIYQFTQSDLWQEMRQAAKLEREKPFYISIPAKEIYQEQTQSDILVQGIIDACYLTKQGELVLVDYKTDFVEQGNENMLKEKYQVQLHIYQKALEEALQKKVDRTYLYSTYLGKEILI